MRAVRRAGEQRPSGADGSWSSRRRRIGANMMLHKNNVKIVDAAEFSIPGIHADDECEREIQKKEAQTHKHPNQESGVGSTWRTIP